MYRNNSTKTCHQSNDNKTASDTVEYCSIGGERVTNKYMHIINTFSVKKSLQAHPSLLSMLNFLMTQLNTVVDMVGKGSLVYMRWKVSDTTRPMHRRTDANLYPPE